MKILISEKQLHLILSTQKVIDEEETSTTDSTSSSTTYPQVGKWESGATRGAGNQLGNTKWSETVGSQLKRGKANQLK